MFSQAQAEQNRVSGQLEKAEFQTNKTEKDKKELERKMSSVDEKVKSHDSIVQGIQKKLESVQNELVRHGAGSSIMHVLCNLSDMAKYQIAILFGCIDFQLSGIKLCLDI